MKNNKKGFTLVELVIVVAVMAVLVAVAIPTVSSIVNSAQEAVDNSNARTIESLIKLAQAEVASGNTTLSAQDIDDAITEGNLGLTGTFKYDSNTGVVTVVADGTTSAATNEYIIVCDAEAAASGEGTAAQTAAQNSVKVTVKAAG